MTKRFFTAAIAGIALMLSTSLVIAADESPDDLLRLQVNQGRRIGFGQQVTETTPRKPV